MSSGGLPSGFGSCVVAATTHSQIYSLFRESVTSSTGLFRYRNTVGVRTQYLIQVEMGFM